MGHGNGDNLEAGRMRVAKVEAVTPSTNVIRKLLH